MSERLDYLIRRNKGLSLKDDYKQMFLLAGIKEHQLSPVPLNASDLILDRVRGHFISVEMKVEELSGSASIADSRILSDTLSIYQDSHCYLYSDDVYYCGMFSADTTLAISKCLQVAKNGYSNSCVILDKDMKFIITVNYYDDDHNDLPNMYEVQAKFR